MLARLHTVLFRLLEAAFLLIPPKPSDPSLPPLHSLHNEEATELRRSIVSFPGRSFHFDEADG
jgi:hypothetical protein